MVAGREQGFLRVYIKSNGYLYFIFLRGSMKGQIPVIIDRRHLYYFKRRDRLSFCWGLFLCWSFFYLFRRSSFYYFFRSFSSSLSFSFSLLLGSDLCSLGLVSSLLSLEGSLSFASLLLCQRLSEAT